MTTHWHSKKTGLRPGWCTQETKHVSHATAFAGCSMDLANALAAARIPGEGWKPAPDDEAAQVAAVRWSTADRLDMTVNDWRIQAWSCERKACGEPDADAGDPAEQEMRSEAAREDYLKARAKRDWWFADWRRQEPGEMADISLAATDAESRKMWHMLLWA